MPPGEPPAGKPTKVIDIGRRNSDDSWKAFGIPRRDSYRNNLTIKHAAQGGRVEGIK